MELSDYFMMPGIQIWIFIAQTVLPFLEEDMGFHTFMSFWCSLVFWSWVYSLLAKLCRITFGLEGRRHG